jgi:hypothetical protein
MQVPTLSEVRTTRFLLFHRQDGQHQLQLAHGHAQVSEHIMVMALWTGRYYGEIGPD